MFEDDYQDSIDTKKKERITIFKLNLPIVRLYRVLILMLKLNIMMNLYMVVSIYSKKKKFVGFLILINQYHTS